MSVSSISDFSDMEIIHNCDKSSDGGSASNSDAEPEMSDYDSDDATIEETVSSNESARNWQYVSSKNDVSIPHYTRNCSLTKSSEHVQTMEECFHLFINEEIMDIIVRRTNEKAKRNMTENKQWKPLDRTELDAFFGLVLLIGRFRESHERKQDLWKIDEGLSRQFYAAIMSRNRFTDILRYIRFDDSATREERKAKDKLAPLRDVTNIFTRNCKNCYSATEAGCVDEQLVTFRGRCSFKVYMRNKPGKYGIKIWTLCDSNTYYCCNMDVYLGKRRTVSEKQEGQRLIKQLTNFWANSGRCVTTNNFFTDLSLAEELLKSNIFLVGTMRKNRNLPRSLAEMKKLTRYSSKLLFAENLSLVSYIPEPRKCAVLLSTLHQQHDMPVAAENFKPSVIGYYNSTKNSVEMLNKLTKEYSCRRCTRRWPLALFLHYLDIAAYNAFVIWKIKHPRWEDGNSAQTSRKIFLQEVAKRLTSRNIDRRAAEFENREAGLHKYVISAIEATGRKILKKRKLEGQKRARCCFCIGSNNKYSSVCKSCKKHVCSVHSTKILNVICNECNTS